MNVNLETNYLGLKLKNPIIVSSSGLTNSVDRIKKAEEYGAAAVVLKSLFEEQIRYETNDLLQYNEYPEANDYITNYAKNNSVEKYLQLIESAKKEVEIPVFASINCISDTDWTGFAKRAEESGVDAIELNIHVMPTDQHVSSAKYEEVYFNIVKKVKSLIKIPVVVKIGLNFTNILYMVHHLKANGADGVVLFNRLYEPDIDIDNLKIVSAEVFSNQSDIRNSLRWIGVLSAQDNVPYISASTGIHDGKAVVKQLLAGADTTQICSTLYKNGIDYIDTIKDYLEKWMYNHKYEKIEDFRGKMNYKNIKDPHTYERVQFMKHFSSIE